MITFSKYEDILINYLPIECVKEIEKHYYRLMHDDVLKKIKEYAVHFIETKQMLYHYHPVSYIYKATKEKYRMRSDEEEKQELILLSRYFIHNSDAFIRSDAYSFYVIVKNRLIEILFDNILKWNMARYYYEKLTFRTII